MVIGLGYVGLPVAVAFARKVPGTIGFDINENRVRELQNGFDRTGEVSATDLNSAKLIVTSDVETLRGATFFIVAVPTPVSANKQPDLGALVAASETVGRVISVGAVVVFESTVYPGVTEEICGPIIERVSGLKRGAEFTLGYSPERINPGDTERSFEKIIKVVSGEDEKTLERVANAYGSVVTAGIFRAASIKVAEAAKVIENTQRDLNIALMNELSLIFDRMGIRTQDVLAAAGTKWNFAKFSPGLVGGHCIGVDPYYLTTKAEQLGYHPQVILAGRRINDSMGIYVAERLVKLMIHSGIKVKNARVGILGLTFKENVGDIRNTRVPDIVRQLAAYETTCLVHDPVADASEAMHEHGLQLVPWEEVSNLDACVIAVAHRRYLDCDVKEITDKIKQGGVVVDVRGLFDPKQIRSDLQYWSL